MTPLAQTRERRHFVYMIRRSSRLAFMALFATFAVPAFGQVSDPLSEPPSESSPEDELNLDELLDELEREVPDRRGQPDNPDNQDGDSSIDGMLDLLDQLVPPDQLPEASTIDPETGETLSASGGDPEPRPDIVILSQKDRQEQLDRLFEKLADTQNPEVANLVAEEIWAIWLQSGSASIDYLLLRGTTAQKAGNVKLARRMYERVIALAPDYAEGWTRSGRLAMDEGDLAKARHDITKSLTLEPRHFYSLWTLGNIFERLDQTDNAFAAYEEALALYPALKAVKDRVEALRESVKGQSL